jgi:hypothetical protein
MLQIPGASSYIGCIGKDKFGEEMKKNAQAAGINVSCKAPFFFFMAHYLISQLATITPPSMQPGPLS